MLKRFGVSLEEDLLVAFDALVTARGYTNRSEAIRDLIRDALVDRDWASDDAETAAAVVLVYDHHRRDLASKLTDLQHRALGVTIAAMHAHLDHDNCLEVILLRGKARELKRIGDQLIATKGVKHGRLVGTTTGSAVS